LSFNLHSFNLPVAEVVPEILQKLSTNNTLIINAPTGAGKSTLLPLALLNENWLNGKKIYMLEPRRLAAKTIAYRMAEMLGEQIGESIGYRIRFESKTSSKTKIEVLTEGILTRMLQSDNALEDAAAVIFDEFHERSIHADVALALSREAQQILRPDLKIVVMSATLDLPQLSGLLNAPTVKSEGRLYPVDIKYGNGNDVRHIPEICAQTTIQAVKENTEGDTLVFLPGQAEIKRCEDILRSNLREFEITPLYGMLSSSQQQRAILPSKSGKRKVVLATTIAETSLTIQGITIVVDSGFVRVSKFDPNSGLFRLETIQVDKDSATQRTGRAGRLSPGTCYRIWTKATHAQLTEHRTPEILEADLADLVLDMAQWGVSDIRKLTWLNPPPTGHINQAKELLTQLEAIGKNKITEHGRKMHSLPCHPRLAHMLLKADELNQVALAADIAAVLEEKDPLQRDSGIDLCIRIEKLRRFRKTGKLSGVWKRINQISNSYRRLFKTEEDNSHFDPYDAGLILVFAYPERIAHSRPGNNAQFQLANGKIAMIGHKDDLAFEPWLAVANVNARDGVGKIFLAAPLNPTDLQPFLETKEVVKWDSRIDEFSASTDLRIGSIILQSKPLQNPDPELKIEAICDAIRKDGKHLLDLNAEFKQLQNRVKSLSIWNTKEDYPSMDTQALFETAETWLGPYLKDVKRIDDLKKLKLAELLFNALDWDFQQKLNAFAPVMLDVPSGSSVKLEYKENGDSPILAVRLQEVFGLENTPSINQGKNSVILHLLSPGFKPVQITKDLKSFWANTYFEVRKELKRRYPKHSWPENPLEAVPVRGVKKK
jgi:ATP-dependent helicase HrpB